MLRVRKHTLEKFRNVNYEKKAIEGHIIFIGYVFEKGDLAIL